MRFFSVYCCFLGCPGKDGLPSTSQMVGCKFSMGRDSQRKSGQRRSATQPFHSHQRSVGHTRPGPDPDMFIAEARARGKLEVAINTLGKDDPAVSFLKESLPVAQAQCQVRLVGRRIEVTQEIIVRAKKRIQGAREEVTRAQEAADAADAKLHNEEESLKQGEARLASLQLEAEGAPQRQVLPPVPSDLADELVHLRECVNDLRREGDELRSQVDASDRDLRGESRKKSKSLATPSVDLMITDHRQQTTRTQPSSVGRHPGVVMENMINQADTAIRGNRFESLAH